MTYNTSVGGKSAILTEWTRSTAQTLNSGDKLTFTSSRSTGTSGVTINASGDISLASGKHYWAVLSVDVSRSNTSAGFSFGFYDQSGTLLDAADGASQSSWEVGLGANNISSTCQAVLLDTTQTYSIRATIGGGTLTTETPSLIITEA